MNEILGPAEEAETDACAILRLHRDGDATAMDVINALSVCRAYYVRRMALS